MRAIAAVLLGAVMVLAAAAPASAAGEVQLSSDGSTWSSSLGSPLFATAPDLVPMQTASATFWVRNSASDAAYLRLTVDNLSWSGVQYASALSVAASVPGTAGTPLTLGSSSECMVLLDGILLAAGQSVKVTTTLALGDLVGTAGQTGAAAMDIAVGLDQAVTAPTAGCNPAAVPASTVTVVPPASVPTRSTGAVATASPLAEYLDMVSLPAFIPGSAILDLLPNTLVSFDSSLVGWATAGVPLGAALFFLVGVIRRLVRGPREEHQS